MKKSEPSETRTLQDYQDLLHLPHHTSPYRPRMSRENRAAQFAPFAALTGYGSAIEEVTRETTARKEWYEDEREELERKLHWLAEHPVLQSEVRIQYFVPDETKEGGAQAEVTGRVKQVDFGAEVLRLVDGQEISLWDILDLSF